ncbi:GNAT family N-acetyltransferase [Salegentibacter flavus]|uniref:Acetyltransferase (GNAT) domain-containing protein n=1 Tax=Salegentibacter flavus TaxID=287099 RepID=A0A1I5BGW4_9FLAO|nr:GNAT family N-acetyltransferase [Salegentibacter flavus]SFN73819.1 Acetyltransferase (GNAT) domain-containing protein [Salegentibacter flavus]
MIIREATHSDIPQILNVLKASLGETSSKKTEAVWRFKHIKNPFGESLVLVAEENNEIVGVRAFMRWRWQRGEQVYSAFRAVDTATHPDHQGKGIFKKLTLKALEIGKERGDDFVFNTPNTQSKPGYLKMGWEEVDKLKIQLRPLNLLQFKNKELEYETSGKEVAISELMNTYFEQLKTSDRLFTPKDIAYIKWRYLHNPLQNYVVIFDREYFIAGYVKERKKFNEFRVSEAIISKLGKKPAKSALLKLAKSSGAKVLSVSPDAGLRFKAGITGNFGPVLTYKPINLDQPEFLNLKTWAYSLGDLELF